MRKYFFALLFLIVFLQLFHSISFADTATGSGAVNIQVSINGYSLSLSGFLAPYASITFTSNGNVFASATADASGDFIFSSVRVAKGFSTFCLDGIDYKRLGESESCFTIPPVVGPSSKTQIFLPPTLGVFRADVTVGNKALVFGYGMPQAEIAIKLDGNTICQKTADTTGYYECSFAITKEGNHEVYADSRLGSSVSEPQLKRVLIKGIALAKVTPSPSLSKLPALLTGLPGILVGLFVALLLLILLILLLRKFNPAWLPRIYLPRPQEVMHHAFDTLVRERKLHHWWMKGVGY